MRLLLCLALSVHAATVVGQDSPESLRIGIIGLDTSHSLAFTKVINAATEAPLSESRVTVAYPHGSPDIESSTSRIPKYTAEMEGMGIVITDDIPSLIDQVDAVLLETNDGRPHLEQVAPVLKAGKRCFIDKPIAGSLVDCLAIFKLAEHYNVPVFSSSSLRYGSNTQAARGGSLGEITGCSTWSPCSLEPTHPDLFWYGIHGVESLFTVMGPGVESVIRAQTDDYELVTGVWKDGRIGTFRGLRAGKRSYGGTAFGTKGTGDVGGYDGYAPLVVEIVKFFQTGAVPIEPQETIDIYAFMEAADESRRQGFRMVSVSELLQQAERDADAKVKAIIDADK